MAVEADCDWLCIHLPTEVASEQLQGDCLEMCRDEGILVTIDDLPDTARTLGLHGVRLTRDYPAGTDPAAVAAVREDLGPEAIIGVEVDKLDNIADLIAADIDFVTFDASVGFDKAEQFIKTVKSRFPDLAIVAQGDFSPERARQYLQCGFNAIAIGSVVDNAPDFISELKKFLTIQL